MSAIDQAEKIIGQSDCFLSVMEHTSQLAALNKPVLIIGERGTGKELIAARLHYLSPRWDSNYLSLNCAALNENLLESELFGHESGAFTGASKRHMGRFERANNGSLFLDELANTPPLVQEKLLRVIEYGEFERVGGSQSVRVDVRLIAATNEDLPSLAREGKFRADLLDRLAFDVITLPPLRERGEDILLLAEHFAVSMAKQLQLELFPVLPMKRFINCLAIAGQAIFGSLRMWSNAASIAMHTLTNPSSAFSLIRSIHPIDRDVAWPR